jgi:hypothetical protein
MTTTITKTIGIGGTHNYSSLSAWEADTNAFTGGAGADLVAADTIAIGQCFFNGSGDGEFGGPGAGVLLNLTGHTTDASHTITLTTGAGQSFRDNANVQTNALNFNQANGVAITTDDPFDVCIRCSDNYVTFSNLQIGSTGNGCMYIDGNNVTINDCVIINSGAGSGGECFEFNNAGPCTVTNTLFMTNGGDTGLGLMTLAFNSSPFFFYFCTLVAPSDSTYGGTCIDLFNLGSATFENCAFFGPFASMHHARSGSNVPTYTNCMTDIAGPPSGVTGSKTYANQFHNTTNAAGDWREKTGADLQGAGTADSTDGAMDIAGTARPQGGNWDIGCWELLASGTIVSTDAWVPIELLAMQRTDPSSRVEFITMQRADFGMVLEHLGIQRANHGLLLEAMATQRADPGLVLEAMATQRANLLAPLELVAVLGNSLGLPIELGGGVTNDTTGRVESLAEALADQRVVTEWLASLLQDAPAPGEFAAIVAGDAPVTAEWLSTIVTLLIGNAVLPIEWSALPPPLRVSLERLLVSPGRRSLLSTPGRLRLLKRP